MGLVTHDASLSASVATRALLPRHVNALSIVLAIVGGVTAALTFTNALLTGSWLVGHRADPW